jgi:hypothetical protein
LGLSKSSTTLPHSTTWPFLLAYIKRLRFGARRRTGVFRLKENSQLRLKLALLALDERKAGT